MKPNPFPLFTEWHKRAPNRDELQIALTVHAQIHKIISREQVRYDEAFKIVTRGFPQYHWTVCRYLGFDARPPASQFPSAVGRQAIFHDRSATRRACQVLEQAFNAAPITLKTLGLHKRLIT